ncbi:MAG: hypothetical protein ACK5P6_09395 [Pseudobdellovibrionaceae bacterium]
MRSMLLGIVAVFLSGCLTVRDKGQSSGEQAQDVQGFEVRDSEIYSHGPVFWDETPNSYRVQFSKTDGDSFVSRTDLKTQERVILESRSATMEDRTVVSGQSYLYQETDQFQRVLQSYEVEIPVDFVIEGDLPVNHPITAQFHRIFLGSKARIQINQFEVDWSADRVYVSPGAQVLAFPQGQSAPQGQVGRDGGVFKLKARKISGALALLMNGEHGGAGLPADIPKLKVSDVCTRDTWMPESQGGQGFPGGDSARFQIATEVPGELLLLVQVIPGTGGNGGRGTLEISPKEKWRGPAREATLWCEWGLRKGPQGPEGPAGKSQLSLIHDGSTVRYYP